MNWGTKVSRFCRNTTPGETAPFCHYKKASPAQVTHTHTPSVCKANTQNRSLKSIEWQHAFRHAAHPLGLILPESGNGASVVRRLLPDLRERARQKDAGACGQVPNSGDGRRLQHPRCHPHHVERPRVLLRPARDVGAGADGQHRQESRQTRQEDRPKAPKESLDQLSEASPSWRKSQSTF